MPFPISLNGKLELTTGHAKPEKLRDAIVSSINSLEGFMVHTDNLTIFFTCYWSPFRDRGYLTAFSRGKIDLHPKESSIVADYHLSLFKSFVFAVVLGGLLMLSIGLNIRKEMTSSPFVPPILFLLWWVFYAFDYLQRRKKIHSFLSKCAYDAIEQDAKS